MNSPDKPDLVERRQNTVQRQIELDKGTVNVKFRGRTPAGAGRQTDTMMRLPVGQHVGEELAGPRSR
jgi:hypothetical protein